MKIPFVYNADLVARGIKVYLSIDLDTHSHWLCCGATGTGKSYSLAIFLGKIAKYEPTARLVVCDFKKASFGWLDGRDGFYGYTAVADGIDTVYREFQRRLELNDNTRNTRRILCVVDEYAALINFLDKKAADEVKRKIAEILMMGRSLGVHLIIGIQRADAEFFKSGARDQFGAVLMLGNLSKEQKQMLAPDYRDQMTAVNQRGQGYLLLDGQGICRVQVPRVTDVDKLHRAIASRLSLPTPPDDAGEA